MESENAVEVHYNGKLLCVIYGADGPGIRIVSMNITNACSVKVEPAVCKPGIVEVMIR